MSFRIMRRVNGHLVEDGSLSVANMRAELDRLTPMVASLVASRRIPIVPVEMPPPVAAPVVVAPDLYVDLITLAVAADERRVFDMSDDDDDETASETDVSSDEDSDAVSDADSD